MPAVKMWRPQDSKKFCRDLKIGDTYYYVVRLDGIDKHARRNRLSFDSNPNAFEEKAYSTIVFDGRLPFTGNPCTEGGYSADTFCVRFGPIYSAPPPGLRYLHEKLPQFPPNASSIGF